MLINNIMQYRLRRPLPPTNPTWIPFPHAKLRHRQLTTWRSRAPTQHPWTLRRPVAKAKSRCGRLSRPYPGRKPITPTMMQGQTFSTAISSSWRSTCLASSVRMTLKATGMLIRVPFRQFALLSPRQMTQQCPSIPSELGFSAS